MVGFPGLSVPLGGVGALGPVGEATDSVVGDAVTGVFVAVVRVVPPAGEAASGVELFERELTRFVRATDSQRNNPLVARSATKVNTRNFEMLTRDFIGGLSSFYWFKIGTDRSVTGMLAED